MKNIWTTANGSRMATLKKVGDLQNYGSPLLSLYYDTESKFIYLSVSVSKRREFSSWLFFAVGKSDLKRYLNRQACLPSIMKAYAEFECMLKTCHTGNKEVEWMTSESIPSNMIPEEDFFEEEFFKDRIRVSNFLKGGKFEIKEREICYGNI